MLTSNIGKERKMDKNRKKKAMTLSLNPMIQSLILHMYTTFEDSSLHSSRENCDTNLALKDIKMDKLELSENLTTYTPALALPKHMAGIFDEKYREKEKYRKEQTGEFPFSIPRHNLSL